MMMASKTFLFFFIVYSIIDQGHAFNSQVKKLQFQSVGSKLLRATRQSTSSPSLMTMRDASASYWFQVGDRVRVVDDVPKAGINLRNRVGNVIETWEKCEVDPTCCCAEFVDKSMAVRVEFCGTEVDENIANASFCQYFGESELEHERD